MTGKVLNTWKHISTYTQKIKDMDPSDYDYLAGIDFKKAAHAQIHFRIGRVFLSSGLPDCFIPSMAGGVPCA